MVDGEAFENSDDVDGEEQAGEWFISDPKIIKLPYIISDWKEPRTQIPRLSVAILIPSGVSPSDISCRILEGGEVLLISSIIPEEMVKMEKLHKLWINHTDPAQQIQDYHPKIIKQFKSVGSRFRHSRQLHSLCFHAAAQLTAKMIESCDPLVKL